MLGGGVIIQQATKVGERKKRKCDRVSPWIERVCDYELRPNVETPATDAFLDEVRAQGVEMMREHPSIKLCSLTHICDELAAQIRKGVQL